MNDLNWNNDTELKFKAMIERIPIFMRPIAEGKVLKKAKELASDDNRTEMNEKDLVDAFFAETPGGFYGPMKVDMEELGIDYTQYGYEKDEWKNIMGGGQ